MTEPAFRERCRRLIMTGLNGTVRNKDRASLLHPAAATETIPGQDVIVLRWECPSGLNHDP